MAITSSSCTMTKDLAVKKVNVVSRKIKKKSAKKPKSKKPMSPVQVKAEEKLRSILKLDLSKSFVKLMKPSIVGGGYWLGLPSEFCSSMLPEEDTDFTVVDEDLEEYTVKYLPANKGMSGGWRGFSNAHNLKPQDALIFQLTKDTEFKVYIVRGEAESEREDDEEESQEVLVRKRNARLKIMIQEQEFFKLRNDSIRRDREMMMKKLESMSSQDDQVKSDLAASSINALSLE